MRIRIRFVQSSIESTEKSGAVEHQQQNLNLFHPTPIFFQSPTSIRSVASLCSAACLTSCPFPPLWLGWLKYGFCFKGLILLRKKWNQERCKTWEKSGESSRMGGGTGRSQIPTCAWNLSTRHMQHKSKENRKRDWERMREREREREREGGKKWERDLFGNDWRQCDGYLCRVCKFLDKQLFHLLVSITTSNSNNNNNNNSKSIATLGLSIKSLLPYHHNLTLTEKKEITIFIWQSSLRTNSLWHLTNLLPVLTNFIHWHLKRPKNC